jgi:hypothetical protein
MKTKVMKVKNVLLITVIILFSNLLIQCSKDDDEGIKQTGTLAVKLTDAPSDDASIQGTFVTVSEVKVDGEPVEGFTKQTIEISAYQQGDAKLLINEDVEAKTYHSISLVFDYETDESGNSPGCYVLADDNMKHDLSSGSQTESEMTFTGDFEVGAQSQSSWVIDFNLRKAVARENDSSTDTKYTFVASSEIQNSFRIVKEENSGEIHGNVTGSFSSGDELYVYAYNKGEFNASTEMQGEGSNNVLFANAVTSAKVKADGSYTLAFLQEGDYEIHVASYEQNNDEESEFKALLDINSKISGILLNNVNVSSETTVEVNIDVLGII